MMKNSQIVLFVIVVVLLGGFILYYSLVRKPSPSLNDLNTLTEEEREAKFVEISQSLTVQKETPKFKAKLEEMSKSLNK